MGKNQNGIHDSASEEQLNHDIISDPKLDEVIESLRPDQRSVIVQAMRKESFSGPLPHPELLRKYNEIQPDFAERIVSMAERQLDHRIKCEDAVISASVSESKRGQWFGIVVALVFLAAALTLGLTGHDWLAGILGGGTLVALVTVFVKTKQSDKVSDQDQEKSAL